MFQQVLHTGLARTHSLIPCTSAHVAAWSGETLQAHPGSAIPCIVIVAVQPWEKLSPQSTPSLVRRLRQTCTCSNLFHGDPKQSFHTPQQPSVALLWPVLNLVCSHSGRGCGLGDPMWFVLGVMCSCGSCPHWVLHPPLLQI